MSAYERVTRPSDHDPDTRLAVTVTDDGDVVLAVGRGLGESVTFATHRGGGRSPLTRRAARGLYEAMRQDRDSDGGRKPLPERTLSTEERAHLERFVRDALSFDGLKSVATVISEGLDGIFAEAERVGIITRNLDRPDLPPLVTD